MPEKSYTANLGGEFTTTLGAGTRLTLEDTVTVGRKAELVGGYTQIGYHTTMHEFQGFDIPPCVRIRKAKFEITASAPTHSAARDLRLAVPTRDGKWDTPTTLAPSRPVFRNSNICMDDQGAGLLSSPDIVLPFGNSLQPVVGPTATEDTTTLPVSAQFMGMLKCDSTGTLSAVGVSLTAGTWTGSAFLQIHEILSTLPVGRGEDLSVGPVIATTNWTSYSTWTASPFTPFTLPSPLTVTAGKFYAVSLGLVPSTQLVDNADALVHCTTRPTETPLSDGVGVVKGLPHRNADTDQGLYHGYGSEGLVPTTTVIQGEDPALVSDNTFALLGTLSVTAGQWVDEATFSWGSPEYSPTGAVDLKEAIQAWVDDDAYVQGTSFALMVDSLATSPLNDVPYNYYPAFDSSGTPTGFAPTLTICYEVWTPPAENPSTSWDTEDTDPSSTYTAVDTDPSSTHSAVYTDPSSTYDTADTDPSSSWKAQHITTSIGGDPANMCLDPIDICMDPIQICGTSDWDLPDSDPSSTYSEVNTDPSSTWAPEDVDPSTVYTAEDADPSSTWDAEDTDPSSSWDTAFDEDCD